MLQLEHFHARGILNATSDLLYLTISFLETCEIVVVDCPFSQHVNVNVKSRTPPAVAEPDRRMEESLASNLISNASLTHQQRSANTYQSNNSNKPATHNTSTQNGRQAHHRHAEAWPRPRPLGRFRYAFARARPRTPRRMVGVQVRRMAGGQGKQAGKAT
jgi:hypothetical protein